MKTIILSVKYSDTEIEVRWVSDPEAVKTPIATIEQPQREVISTMAQSMEWLKLAARKNNQKIKQYINDVLIVDKQFNSNIN